MKTLPVKLRFVVIGVAVIVAVVSCCNFPFIPDIALYSVEIRNQKGPTYVEWKSEKKFNEALARIRGHNDQRASYCFCVIKKPRDDPQKYKFNDKCDYKCPPGDIRTVKITRSKAADNIAAAESAVNDPNVMHTIRSPYARDISNVINALNNK